MKTPYAILIGLALIAAAIFYREQSVSTAQAGGVKVKYMDGFKCNDRGCAVLHGDNITFINYRILTDLDNTGLRKNKHHTGIITTWR